MTDWPAAVVLPDKLLSAVEMYHLSGEGGRFPVPQQGFDRRRGKRFDMPSLGMRSIVFANLFALWSLTKITI